MQRMGVEALYRRPRTTKPHPGHRVFPYLLRGKPVDRANQVWALDITYLPDETGFCVPGVGVGLGVSTLARVAAHVLSVSSLRSHVDLRRFEAAGSEGESRR